MSGFPIKHPADGFIDLFTRMQRDHQIYDQLTPEERAEVDAFNVLMVGKSLQQIVDMGDHPMKRLREKYGDGD